MRSLNRNKRTIYYSAVYDDEKIYDSNGDFTGEYDIAGDDPTEFKINFSANTGEAEREIFGIINEYQRVMVTNDMNCPIRETYALWVNTDPTDEPYDYIVLRRADSLNSISFLIQEVKVGG